jgi:hypothetical protein
LRLTRGALPVLRLARAVYSEFRLARAILLVFRFARLSKRDSSRPSLAKRDSSRRPLAKRYSGRLQLRRPGDSVISGCGQAGASEADPYVRPRARLRASASALVRHRVKPSSALASSPIKQAPSSPRASRPYVYTAGTRSGRKAFTANNTPTVRTFRHGRPPTVYTNGPFVCTVGTRL